MKKRFKNKRIILCCDEKVHHLDVPSWMQVAALLFVLLLGYWLVRTTVIYFWGNELLWQKEAALAEEMNENARLQQELGSYQQRVEGAEKLAIDVQEAHKDILDKVDTLVSQEIKKKENNLEKLEKTLQEKGKPLSSLLKKLQRNKGGVGGPYVPDMQSSLLTVHYSDKLGAVYDKLDKLEGLATLTEVMPLGSPVKNVRVSASFGRRKDPFTGKPAKHEGIDLGGAMKTPIYATANGKVKRAFANGSYGLFIEIVHDAGFMTRYAHLSKIDVKVGDEVSIGDKIGLMGNSGRSTGPHLHYEVLLDKEVVNPYRFMMIKRGS